MRLICTSALALAALYVFHPITGQSYSSSGHKWTVSTVPYYINPTNRDVSSAAALAALQDGAAVWASQSNANFAFKYMGTTSGSAFQYNKKNEVFFRNASNGSLVAETYRWYNASGDIIDADIAFYDAAFTFTADAGGCSGAMVIDNFAAHEFGHALGLSHSSVSSATMYPASRTCSDAWMTLDQDDISGVEKLYPPTSSKSTDDVSTTNVKPEITIATPGDGITITVDDKVMFSGTAVDKEDGDLSSGLKWVSSIDGVLGVGKTLTTGALSKGSHTITAKVKDSNGVLGTAKMAVTVVSTSGSTGGGGSGSTTGVSLDADGYLNKYNYHRVKLAWSGLSGDQTLIYRNDVKVSSSTNDGSKTDAIKKTGSAVYYYKVCQTDGKTCSSTVKVVF